MTRKFLIWTRGYAGDSRVAVTDGEMPKLNLYETVAWEIKTPVLQSVFSEIEARKISARDNS